MIQNVKRNVVVTMHACGIETHGFVMAKILVNRIKHHGSYSTGNYPYFYSVTTQVPHY